MALPHAIDSERRLALLDGRVRLQDKMADKFPFTKLDTQQQKLLDEHLQAARISAQSTESLRNPQELKYVQETITKLYAGLDLPTPAIHILSSPMSCAFAWAHTPQGIAERWKVFHDDFYTHPLSSPIVDVIADGFNAFTRMVEHSISTSIEPKLSSVIEEEYLKLERVGDLAARAITSVENPLSDAQLMGMF